MKKKKNTIMVSLLCLIIAIAIVIIGVSFSKKQETSEDFINDKQQEAQITDENKDRSKEDDMATSVENNNQNSEEHKMQEPKVVLDNGYIEGQTLPTEPTYIKGVLIANKKYPLPKDFAPGEDPKARAAFDLMAQDAKKQGYDIVAFSTYRSYEYQSSLYNKYVAKDGKDNADRYSARPGYSEHQTGLAFDVGEKGKENLWLTEEFGETDAGKWLMENAHKYGFILRYPKGKEDITGYMYESWHYRYLGIELATKVKESGLTLEEYLGIE